MTGFMGIQLFLAQVEGGGLADTAREIGETFGFSKALFASQVISFLIVALLLHRFAYKPILRVLEERRQRIAESLAQAEKIKEELAKTEAARKQLLEQAGTQANQLIEEARAAAARVQEQETQRAIKVAEEIIARARQVAETDHARMLAELRREVGQLVVQTTAKVSGKVLTPADQQRLVEETNRELAA